MITTPTQAAIELRKMQAQIISGTKIFGEIADVLDALVMKLEKAEAELEKNKESKMKQHKPYIN